METDGDTKYIFIIKLHVTICLDELTKSFKENGRNVTRYERCWCEINNDILHVHAKMTCGHQRLFISNKLL